MKTPLPNANSSFQFAASWSNEPNENGPSSRSWLLLFVGASSSQMIGTMKKSDERDEQDDDEDPRQIHCRWGRALAAAVAAWHVSHFRTAFRGR